MKWYWKVRMAGSNGDYWTCQIETERNLNDIAVIRDFFRAMTGCAMLLEGMSSEGSYEGVSSPHEAFVGLF